MSTRRKPPNRPCLRKIAHGLCNLRQQANRGRLQRIAREAPHRVQIPIEDRLRERLRIQIRAGIRAAIKFLKDLLGGKPFARMQQNQRKAFRLVKPLHLFADARHARKSAIETKRDVRAEPFPDLRQLFHRQAQAPQAVERQKRRRAIRASSAQPRANGNTLFQRDVRAEALSHIFV